MTHNKEIFFEAMNAQRERLENTLLMKFNALGDLNDLDEINAITLEKSMLLKQRLIGSFECYLNLREKEELSI